MFIILDFSKLSKNITDINYQPTSSLCQQKKKRKNVGDVIFKIANDIKDESFFIRVYKIHRYIYLNLV